MKLIGSSLNHNQNSLNLDQYKGLKTPMTSHNRYESRIGNVNTKGETTNQIISSPTQLTNSNIRDFEEDLGFLQKMINAE